MTLFLPHLRAHPAVKWEVWKVSRRKKTQNGVFTASGHEAEKPETGQRRRTLRLERLANWITLRLRTSVSRNIPLRESTGSHRIAKKCTIHMPEKGLWSWTKNALRKRQKRWAKILKIISWEKDMPNTNNHMKKLSDFLRHQGDAHSKPRGDQITHKHARLTLNQRRGGGWGRNAPGSLVTRTDG